MFGHAAGSVVSNEGSDIGTGTRDDTDHGSDEARNRSNTKDRLHILLCRKKSCYARIDLIRAVDILNGLESLAHREETDHNRNVLDTGEKVCVVCETDVACYAVDTDSSC